MLNNKLKQNLACYIWLERISFDIEYNELAHENITNVEYLFVHRVEKTDNINLFKMEMEGHKTALIPDTNIYLSSTTLQSQIIS